MPFLQAFYLLAAVAALSLLGASRRLHPLLALSGVALAFGYAAGMGTAQLGRAFGNGFAQAVNTTGLAIIAGAIVAEKYKKFYMITTAFPFEWQPLKLKYSALFFFHPGPGAEVPFEIWDKLPANEKPKNPALVTEDSPDGKGFGGAFEAAAKKYGYTFAVDDPWAIGATDYSALITKLKAANVDAMLVFGS
ncbi:MAG: ABC transporter substrate-binding protein, partial [Ferrovibrionaceae bacterium]